MDYEKQAEDFLTETKTFLSSVFVKHGKHFSNDEQDRDIYEVTLSRGTRRYVFKFGQSINDSLHPDTRIQSKNRLKYLESLKPSAYSVLASLTKYEVGTFDDFCSMFDYDNDSIRANATYKAVCDEYSNLQKLFTDDEMIKLQEIQ